MKLRNKKTGEVVELPDGFFCGDTLKKICEEWEDYEEPKEDGLDNIITLIEAYSSIDSKMYPKEIVEKLKAVKRLKDKGFRFEAYKPYGTGIMFTIAHMNELAEDSRKDLDLLFGGEE